MKKAGKTRSTYRILLSACLAALILFCLLPAPAVYGGTPGSAAAPAVSHDAPGAASPETAPPETLSREKVRVGWYQSDMFQEGTTDGEIKSGYCYDFLQKVSDYTGWEYEYVYGSWTELFHKLQQGEIDCLGGVSYTEERAASMLFPDTAMGTDQYYLFHKARNDAISPQDPGTLNGRKVGVIRDNRIGALTLSWMAEKAVDLEVISYDSFEEQEAAFERGEIDLLAQTVNNVLDLEGISITAKIGEEPYYLAISRQNPELLTELNDSLNTLLSIDPFILQNLQYGNYGATLIGKTLTDNEEAWIDSHPTITVAYLENYLPYCATDRDGRAVGLMTDTLDAILSSLGLADRIAMTYVPYTNFDDMTDAVRRGQADMAFPVYGNLWELEQNQIDASSPVVQGSESFISRGLYDRSQIRVIAVNDNNRMQIAYCRKYFPEVTLLSCGSINEALDAVLEGRADGTIINTLRTELVTGSSRYKGLSCIQLEGDDNRCFGVNEKNTELILILNRGLRIIGASFGIESSYKYMESFYSYDIQDFFLNNLAILLPLLLLFVGGIILLLTWNLHRKAQQVREKEAHIRQVQALNTELEALRRKADAANEAKTTFLFNMSHDIRTPMNAILGFSRLMEKNLDKPDILKDELKKIEASGELLLALINNMLEVARIDSGKEELNEVVMDVENDRYAVFPIFEQEIREKNLTVSHETQVQHRYVYADTHKISEITMNLVSNAVKYTPEGGSIRSTLTEIPCDSDGFAAYVYTIRDTGIGMSPEFQKVIFESFSRERNTTESRIPGTGLGMAVVKRLVDLMGGTITLESEPGKGCCFTVTLRHRIAEAPAAEALPGTAPAAGKPDFTGRRLLLTEDNDLNAEIAAAILEDFGLTVDRAPDGTDCLAMLTEHPAGYYDLILMDIQMPKLNGYETASAIRRMEDPVKAAIPIIAMTANAFDEDKENAIDAGMKGHLAKPIEVDKLTAVLKTYLTPGDIDPIASDASAAP